jgi:hypothetical protein
MFRYHDHVASFLLWTLNLPGNPLPSHDDTVSTAKIMQCQTATVETPSHVR